MTRGTRRWLFYGLLALFLIAGASVVLYAEGVRLDFTTGKISKIGAIFVRSYPDDAAIKGDLISRADIALYEAKHAGKNKTFLYSSAMKDSKPTKY